jgi:hypothetical protein
MNLIKHWEIEIDLSNYNFYLMPLAYVDSKVEVSSITTDEVRKYLDFVKNKVTGTTEDDYTIAISIDIQFNKSNSFDAIGMRYAKDGIPITLTEEDIRNRFPLTTKQLTDIAKNRYSDFKQDKKFNSLMRTIKTNEKLSYVRQLDPENTKSNKKPFYSSNILQELDKHYTKIKKTTNA